MEIENATGSSMEIYIHIPFCVKKCDYCDFLSGPSCPKEQAEYVQALFAEIDAVKEGKGRSVSSIFIGGGTPSVLDERFIGEILNKTRKNFLVENDAEITIEVNPGTADQKKLQAYRTFGINRLSIGLQSPDDRELKILGRIHNYEQFLETCKCARTAGFENINIDLMSAIPDQTYEKWCNNLRIVAELKPEHISAYSLIIEEGTPFASRQLNLPDEDTEYNMYEATSRILKEYGYEQYEISNYAKKGYACRHNLVYWQGGDYLGLGLGSSSYMDGVRFHNTTDFNTYVNQGAYVEDREELSVQAKMEEFMFLGLRVMAGVSGTEFEKRFGKTMEDVYGDVLRKHEEEGLLQIERKEDRKEAAAAEPAKGKTNIEKVMLTTKGVDVSNYVFADFLL